MSSGSIQRLQDAINGGERLPYGLGCAFLSGRREKAQSIRLVHAALDAGITYFDTARLYAEGQSEAVLGEALKGRRDSVFLASKAGIWPTEISFSDRVQGKALHVLRGKAPFLRGALPEPKVHRPVFGKFAPEDIRASVEISLRALKTDHLDLLLLHECETQQIRDEAVLDTLRGLKREGKIGDYGSATQPDTTLEIDRIAPTDLSVLQFKNSLQGVTLDSLGATARMKIVHSLLGETFTRFHSFVAARGGDDPLVQEAGFDSQDRRSWGAAMIGFAARRTQGGLALFSTTRPETIAPTIELSSKLSEEAENAIAHLISQFVQAQA